MKPIIFCPLEKGIGIKEEGSERILAYISKNREISWKPGIDFHTEDILKIKDMAKNGNVLKKINEQTYDIILDPVNKRTKEYFSEKRDKMFQLSVERINDKELCCDGHRVFPLKPEECRDIPEIKPSEGQKYCLTEYCKEFEGVTVYRIRALKDFDGVKAGEVGGYVQSYRNLSQKGMCWLHGNSVVYESAQVEGNAQIIQSIIGENAHITDNVTIKYSTVLGKAILKDNVKANNTLILRSPIISDEAHITGKIDCTGFIKDQVVITSSEVEIIGEAIELYDHAVIRGGRLMEFARVSGNATIADHAVISGFAEISGKARIAGNSLVNDFAKVMDDAIVDGNTLVCNSAMIKGQAKIRDKAWISDQAVIKDQACIEGLAIVCGHGEISGKAIISHKAYIHEYAKISGCAQIGGSAFIGGRVMVSGNVKIVGDAKLIGHARYVGKEMIQGHEIIRKPSFQLKRGQVNEHEVTS